MGSVRGGDGAAKVAGWAGLAGPWVGGWARAPAGAGAV